MCQFKINFRIICHEEFNLRDFQLITKLVRSLRKCGNFKKKTQKTQKKSLGRMRDENKNVLRKISRKHLLDS